MKLSRLTIQTALVAVIAAAGLGCAHAPATSSVSPAGSETVVPTGSRLAQPVDPRTGQPTTSQPVRTYGSQELSNTGRTDIGSALQVLDPAARP